MNPPRLSDEELQAFLDDQLGAGDRARVLSLLQQHPDLQQRLAEFQQAKDLLRLAYANPPQASRAPRTSRTFGALQNIAAAALLSLGLAGGWLLHGMLAGSTALHASTPKGVVIQVSEADPAKWEMALINARNVRKAYGDSSINVEIVAYGPGLNMLRKDSPVANGLQEAKENGVKLLACGNSMRMLQTQHDDLHAQVDVVPAGIVEIMEREQEGYAYVRP